MKKTLAIAAATFVAGALSLNAQSVLAETGSRVVDLNQDGVADGVASVDADGKETVQLLKATAADTTPSCGTRVSISSLSGVLYKTDNLHGGRGATMLFQNARERPGKRKLAVYDKNCKALGSFGLYKTDKPYGARYYTRTGGSGQSGSQFRSAALRSSGSPTILVEGRGKLIIVNDAGSRQGSVNK